MKKNLKKGGRFIHLSNDYDKGEAVLEFLKIDGKQNRYKRMTISIGDSHNDISMLELTDYSCIIKREKKKSLVLEKKKIIIILIMLLLMVGVNL